MATPTARFVSKQVIKHVFLISTRNKIRFNSSHILPRFFIRINLKHKAMKFKSTLIKPRNSVRNIWTLTYAQHTGSPQAESSSLDSSRTADEIHTH